MQVKLHKNARTTPAIRRELRESPLSINALAKKYNLSRVTVRKWRRRESVEDRSHRPHELHANLSPLEEEIVVELRKTLLLPLDDLFVIVRDHINNKVSRSGLARCLVRHGVSRLRDLIPQEDGAKPAYKPFKSYQPGFLHVDIKYLPRMPDEARRSYLLVGIDRATRWVYVEVIKNKSAKAAKAFFNRLVAAAPFKVTKVLTDNGKEFTDRFCATGEREPTGNHLFDKVCAANHVEHRLIKPRRPQTNGMVERFNGRIGEVVSRTRFGSALELKTAIDHYVRTYNHAIPQKSIGHISPVQALKQWQKDHPELFKKRIYNQTGLDTYVLMDRLARCCPWS
jgi:IS30 family transposase